MPRDITPTPPVRYCENESDGEICGKKLHWYNDPISGPDYECIYCLALGGLDDLFEDQMYWHEWNREARDNGCIVYGPSSPSFGGPRDDGGVQTGVYCEDCNDSGYLNNSSEPCENCTNHEFLQAFEKNQEIWREKLAE